MNQRRHVSRRVFECTLAFVLCAAAAIVAQAQPRVSFDELDKLVARVALYPDPLLVQLLSAASYSDQIPDAAKWSDQHHYLTGATLAAAISSDHLPWDPTVQALLPFPSVLEMMAGDMAWTTQLGNAVLAQRGEVMDAIQRDRFKAVQFGYLKSTPQVTVAASPLITIRENNACCLVPVYDPAIVFAAPRPGFAVATAINFGFGVSLGVAFQPWWRRVSLSWSDHVWRFGDDRWNRTWANRLTYVQHREAPIYKASQRVETHELIERSAKEKEAPRLGHEVVEEHHRK